LLNVQHGNNTVLLDYRFKPAGVTTNKKNGNDAGLANTRIYRGCWSVIDKKGETVKIDRLVEKQSS